MTTAASPLPIDESPQTVPWRRALLALLPLAFLGLMPWGICLGLSAVILIGLRFPAWGSGRLLLFLFVIAVGALVQVPGAWNSGAGPGLLIALASGYLLQLLLVFLLHFSLIMLEEGQRRGLLLVLLPALFAPQWGLVPALLGGLLAREGPDDRLSSQRAPTQRPVWVTVAGAAAVLVLLGALLPHARVQVQEVATRQAAPPPQEETSSDWSLKPEENGAPKRAAPAANAPFIVKFDEDRLALPPVELLLLFSALLLAALGIILWRTTGGEGKPALTLPEKLMVAGLALTFLLTLLAALLIQGKGQTASQTLEQTQDTMKEAGRKIREMVPEQAAHTVNGTGFFNALSWVTLAAAALVVGLLLLRLRRPGLRLAAQDVEATDETASATAPAPALHRVRLAYRRAEDAFQEAGHARPPAETPAGYAARLSARLPDLAAPLQTLTRVYEPVRDGGHVTDEDADAAEAAANRVTELTSLLHAPDPEGTP